MLYKGHDLNQITNYNPDLLFKKINSTEPEILIFGAGIQSRTIIQMLSHLVSDKINIRLVDSNKNKVGRRFQGLIIEDPTIIQKMSSESTVVLIGCCFPSQILASLGPNLEIYSILPIYKANRDMLLSMDLKSNELKYSRGPGDVEREMILYETEFSNLIESLNNSLSIKSVDAVVTEGCSLKCKDCSNLMQYYKKPKAADLQLLQDSTENILSNIDAVFEWRILGGEPFIYKNLHEYIDYLSNKSKIKSIIIYTNGTIVPSDLLIKSIKESKAIVDISNYGELSRNIETLQRIFDEHRIPYALKEPEWTDSGRITKKQNLDEELLEQRFFNCCTRDVLTLLHGYMYRCPFSANLMNLSKDYIDELDRIYVGDKKDISIREKLNKLYKSKKYLSACDNCNGRDFSTPFVETAVQTRKVLEIPTNA